VAAPQLVPFARSRLNPEDIKIVFANHGLKVEAIQRVSFMWWYVLTADADLYLMDLSNGGGRDGFYLEP